MHIHLIGICGIAMGGLALMLKELGYKITGSDENTYPPMSEELIKNGIEIRKGYKKENLSDNPNLVIIGNAVSRNNPEVVEVLDRKIPYISLPHAISKFFLKGKRPIVIAGTHGKTTTSGLLAWVLEYSKLDPSFLIGGVIKNFGSNFKLGKGEFFIVEGDEYDTAFFDKSPKFLHYNPEIAVLTNIEFDHADIYIDLEHLKYSFKRFVEIVPSYGYLSIHNDIKDIAISSKGKIETYSLDEGNWKIKNFGLENGTTYFRVVHNHKIYGDFELSLLGKHNILNTLAVISVAKHLGISKDKLIEAVKNFKGAKRRQEVIYNNKIMIIDDFAHHPTAVKETIRAIKERYKIRRLWAIFEPRSNTSRRKIFQNIWHYSFLDADKIIISELFNKEGIKEEIRLSPENVVDRLRKMGKDAFFIRCADEIVGFLERNIEPADIILIMSNGIFDGICEKLVNRVSDLGL